MGISDWDIDRLSAHDAQLVDDAAFDSFGIATWSSRFVTCPASFNAIAADLKGAKNDGQATGLAMKHLRQQGLAVLGEDVAAAVRQLRAG